MSIGTRVSTSRSLHGHGLHTHPPSRDEAADGQGAVKEQHGNNEGEKPGGGECALTDRP